MSLKFRRVLISDERYETAAAFDVTGDGQLDIVSGAWWYEGPDFKRRHPIGQVDQVGEYYDDFSTIPLDVNGDGRLDFVSGGWFGESLYWRENPGDPNAQWPLHEIAKVGHVETTRAWDIDGDGVVEIVPNTPQSPTMVFKLKTDAAGKGAGEFTSRVLREEKQGHGIGAGDIAGNGRCDLVLTDGWLEAPEKPFEQEWAWHPEFNLGRGVSVPIVVTDINGSGANDLIVGMGHDYGLYWLEQRIVGGNRQWVRHEIDPWNSQYHDMQWVDIDGDGQCELVTGKRYRAHNGNDPGAADDMGAYYFKWTGESFVKQVINYGPLREATGVGIYFDMADLTGNGLPDLIAPGKDGLYIFYNEGPCS